MRSLASWLFMIIGATPCCAAVQSVDVYEPRAFGYFIGDTLDRRVEIVTTGDTELFSSALPRPGPLTYWLDLVAIDESHHEEGDRKTYEIRLKYQIFYSALDVTKLEIPALPLKFKGAGNDENAPHGSAGPENSGPSASIPAFQFLASPLRDITLQNLMPGQNAEIADVLRPDKPAREIAIGGATRLLGIAIFGMVLSAAGLLWHYAKWPFSRRAGRPFTVADRRIRDLLLTGARSDATYRESLIVLHRAFDESLGRRMFAEDLSVFLGKRQRFANLKPIVVRFFEGSRLYFFSGDKSAAEAALPAEDVVRLASNLAHEEREAA
jgi:mxaA protein